MQPWVLSNFCRFEFLVTGSLFGIDFVVKLQVFFLLYNTTTVE